MDFDTKIAIILREDLAAWQKLNVTSFLTSGILGENPSLIGEEYKDAAGNTYSPLLIQPVIVLSCDQQKLQTIHRRGMEREVRLLGKAMRREFCELLTWLRSYLKL
jgi:hypothetical protein